MSNERLQYVDALRGFTMFLVVFIHVNGHTFNALPPAAEKLLLALRMPMFFFVSGFIAYKPLSMWSLSFFRTRFRKKLFVQTVPASIFFLLCACAYGKNPIDIFCTNGYEKYWFTFVLLYMIVFYYVLSLCAHKWRWSEAVFDGALIVTGLAALCVAAEVDRLHAQPGHWMWDVFFVGKFCRFFFFYTLGVECRKHCGLFHRATGTRWGIFCAVAGYAACCALVFTPWLTTKAPQRFNYFIQFLVVSVFSIFLVYGFFYSFRQTFAKGKRWTRALTFMGRRTLDVYLLHFFFVPNWPPYLPLDCGGETPSWLANLLTVALAAAVYAASLGVSRVIRVSPTLAHWMLGANVGQATHQS